MNAPQTLIVGGTSRLGQALLNRRPGMRAIARTPMNCPAALTIIDYHAITPEMLAGATSVISVVGATSGSAAELDEANALLTVKLASAAKEAMVRRFIYISSFAVFGNGSQTICQGTPVDPQSDYGRSKWRAEQLLAAMRNEAFTPISVRLPSLYSLDQGKLAQLISAWTKFRIFPSPRSPIKRSFMSYDNAAAFLLDITRLAQGKIGPDAIMAADREPFVHEKARQEIKRATRRTVGAFYLPFSEGLLGMVAPTLHASLFQSSFLEPAANAANEMTSTLYNDVADIARRGANLR